jgi:hypothetical protein
LLSFSFWLLSYGGAAGEWLSRFARMIIACGEWLSATQNGYPLRGMKVNFRLGGNFHFY